MAQSEIGTDWMNGLQRLPSQNTATSLPHLTPSFSMRILSHYYACSHPVISADSVHAKRLLTQLNKRATTAAMG
jgi:hypothetical protein